MSQPAGRILLVEDEEALAESIRYSLDREGYAVTVAPDGRRAIERFHDTDPELVILDLMLPELSGPGRRADDPAGVDGADHHRHREGLGGRQGHRARARCRRLRDEAVLGPRARLAGARAPAPRAPGPSQRPTATCWRAVRSRWTSTGTRSSSAATAVAFPPKEFELLETFLRAPGRLLTRELLIQRIWGDDYVGDTKTLDVHVKRVRQKIERDPHEPEHLLTVRGLGYKFVG